MLKTTGAVVLLLVLCAGCVTGSTYSQVLGPYYLKQQDYKEGVTVFKERLKADPQDATAAYYIGRYYMALEKPEQGAEFFQKAVAIAPDNAEYHFWLGVAYWAMLEFDKEREQYLKALKLDPDHISANLYLGHGYMDDGQWAKGLALYDKVLDLDEFNPEALYNRAVALGELGREKEEIAAYKKFLEYYPDGSLAMRATGQLNLRGDFTYRNFILGKRNVTLRTVAFKPGTNDPLLESKESLHVIAAMMDVNDKLDIHVVAYKDGDAAAARARAEGVRDYILSGRPGIDPKRLPLSWFGSAEVIKIEEKTFTLEESVQFVTVTK